MKECLRNLSIVSLTNPDSAHIWNAFFRDSAFSISGRVKKIHVFAAKKSSTAFAHALYPLGLRWTPSSRRYSAVGPPP